MKTRVLFCAALCAQFLAAPAALAVMPAPTGSAEWRYRPGGGEPVLAVAGSDFDGAGPPASSARQQYAWHLWRPYRCCEPRGQKLLRAISLMERGR